MRSPDQAADHDSPGGCVGKHMCHLRSRAAQPLVGVMLFNSQIRFVIKQTVEHMRGITNRRTYDLGVERRILVGNVRVEQHARLIAVTCIDLPSATAVPAGAKVLPIGRRRNACTLVGRERNPVLMVN